MHNEHHHEVSCAETSHAPLTGKQTHTCVHTQAYTHVALAQLAQLNITCRTIWWWDWHPRLSRQACSQCCSEHHSQTNPSPWMTFPKPSARAPRTHTLSVHSVRDGFQLLFFSDDTERSKCEHFSRSLPLNMVFNPITSRPRDDIQMRMPLPTCRLMQTGLVTHDNNHKKWKTRHLIDVMVVVAQHTNLFISEMSVLTMQHN